jgi:hypothetical protein
VSPEFSNQETLGLGGFSLLGREQLPGLLGIRLDQPDELLLVVEVFAGLEVRCPTQ